MFEASVAVALTVVVPSGKTLPDAGITNKVGARSHESFAVTEKVAVAPVGLVASSVRSAGHVIDGAAVSDTVTWNEQPREFGGDA